MSERAYDRLSGLDASFLHLERPETPMHIGALAIFEGAPFFDERGRFRLDELRTLVASRLHLVPRFRKRVVAVPFDAGRPVWVDDERFDVAAHVRLTTLPPPGSREQLLACFERLQAQLLDRSRPLWELWFVEGMADGRVALIEKTHHALVDGISGVEVATVLLDVSPTPTVGEVRPWTPQPAPEPARLLCDTLRERVGEPIALARAAVDAARVPQRAAARAGEVLRSFASVVQGRLVAPRTSLNHPVGPRRRFGPVRISLDDVTNIRRAFGVTLNDVVLAGVTGGLGRLLDARGELHHALELKAFCPVSVRDDGQRLALGNRVSGMIVPLPVAEPDPLVRLDAIRSATTGLKERKQAVAASALVDLAEYHVPTLLSLVARVAQHQPFVNLVCTNVPGPEVPLYCMGARLLEAYPMLPLSRNLSLGVAVLSYCGQLHLGLLADRGLCGDLDVLEAGIEESFAELRRLAA